MRSLELQGLIDDFVRAVDEAAGGDVRYLPCERLARVLKVDREARETRSVKRAKVVEPEGLRARGRPSDPENLRLYWGFLDYWQDPGHGSTPKFDDALGQYLKRKPVGNERRNFQRFAEKYWNWEEGIRDDASWLLKNKKWDELIARYRDLTGQPFKATPDGKRHKNQLGAYAAIELIERERIEMLAVMDDFDDVTDKSFHDFKKSNGET